MLFVKIALCWTAVSILFAAPIALAGYRRKLIRPVNAVSQFSHHVGHDLSELGGLSQSNHFGAIGHNEVRNHVA